MAASRAFHRPTSSQQESLPASISYAQPPSVPNGSNQATPKGKLGQASTQYALTESARWNPSASSALANDFEGTYLYDDHETGLPAGASHHGPARVDDEEDDFYGADRTNSSSSSSLGQPVLPPPEAARFGSTGLDRRFDHLALGVPDLPPSSSASSASTSSLRVDTDPNTLRPDGTRAPTAARDWFAGHSGPILGGFQGNGELSSSLFNSPVLASGPTLGGTPPPASLAGGDSSSASTTSLPRSTDSAPVQESMSAANAAAMRQSHTRLSSYGTYGDLNPPEVDPSRNSLGASRGGYPIQDLDDEDDFYGLPPAQPIQQAPPALPKSARQNVAKKGKAPEVEPIVTNGKAAQPNQLKKTPGMQNVADRNSSSTVGSQKEASRRGDSPVSSSSANSTRQSMQPHRKPMSTGSRAPSIYDSQPHSTGPLLDHSHLRPGAKVSLLTHTKTLELYRANAQKTNDPELTFELAVFMLDVAREANGTDPTSPAGPPSKKLTEEKAKREALLTEALTLLKKVADRGHVPAQAFLADCYTQGIGTKGKQDYDKAFPLFILAGKHGNAEACFRTAQLCENGWGCRKEQSKAVSWYRKAAALSHPAAMYRLALAELNGELGLNRRAKEGVKWLKRCVELAEAEPDLPTIQAMHDLALLHERGIENVVFIDHEYAAELLAKASELGWQPSAYKLGECYEYGRMSCPKDPALSIHYYNIAAQKGHREACFALTAWYLVGSPGVLPQSDTEAFLWAKRAADQGLSKAMYALGYFWEVGIGTPHSLREAVAWYRRAADAGDRRATTRLRSLGSERTGLATAAALGPGPPSAAARRGQAIAVDNHYSRGTLNEAPSTISDMRQGSASNGPPRPIGGNGTSYAKRGAPSDGPSRREKTVERELAQRRGKNGPDENCIIS
ncbi:uncharacterized protein L969DRAFT_75972 [Mixia osmundae IAM 14324]|uniref:Uncharacterized protein n=1 Tax=Mixia osmundae (strain CBS 9802 / IAM 14324 / JCM 22182 / KY 12970) TaxID=764103 RepID=G7E6U7_MIXOS|nr:uncharacterized protein L969DRAFT_75972 [Mixia osmundae IAM 14324]KEI39061.1 hypothetical protein L969DRAFT_75972 [Mixia osmundae IAM 14324]GAA98557.1 hypothetical protein E5Q_05244 [Mixia osmundae IAM 14324]